MSEELRPCPFCGGTKICTEKGINLNYCDNCSAESNVEHWNNRPIEDALQSRIAELEKDLSNKEIEYTDLWDDALALQARIAELEANNAELKERVAMLDVTAVYKSLGEMGYIEQVANLKAENAVLQSRIAELEAERHWIPVSERLPEGEKVLVLWKDGTIHLDWTFIDGGSYYWWNSGQAVVTHWMPLPTPPEADYGIR